MLHEKRRASKGELLIDISHIRRRYCDVNRFAQHHARVGGDPAVVVGDLLATLKAEALIEAQGAIIR